MSKKRPQSRDVLQLFSALTPKGQRKALRAALDLCAEEFNPEAWWIKPTRVAQLLGKLKSYVTKLLDSGKLVSNGKRPRRARADTVLACLGESLGKHLRQLRREPDLRQRRDFGTLRTEAELALRRYLTLASEYGRRFEAADRIRSAGPRR
jgi:hypothetical protein